MTEVRRADDDLTTLFTAMPDEYRELLSNSVARRDDMGNLLSSILGKAVKQEQLTVQESGFLAFFFISVSQPHHTIKPILDKLIAQKADDAARPTS